MKLNLFFLLSLLFLANGFVFAQEEEKIVQQKDETSNIKIIERQIYQVQIKQYRKDYPVVLYIVFKEEIPASDEIKNLLYKELRTISKKEGSNNNIIASAWIDDGTSETLTKIDLSEGSSAFVWISKEKKIMSFSDYLKFLKKQKKDKKNNDIPSQQ
ncbi:MAG: hypothetical protein PHR82_04680 [Endomicrobiaceae bacterium]|nr:hypothetical protein [Endomicrobiaceae bacterium]